MVGIVLPMEKQTQSIETDGASQALFNLLWTKDELNFGPSINIPDTIIFQYGQPLVWYFTASNGKIKKKNRNNLLNARIEDAFTRNILGYDVIATFIAFPPETGSPDQTQTQTIEYLDRKEFQNFLYNRFESNNGILQRFVEPKGTHNEMIRAIWSPKVCLLERAENIHQLHDQRYGLYERCVTYEGPEFYSVSQPLRGPVLAGQLQRLCEAVVSHVAEVTFGQNQISRIVFNFKVDSRDKIWLLYATSIRCSEPPTAFGAETKRPPSLVNIDNVLFLPPSVTLNPNKSYEKVERKKFVRCISCGNESLEDVRHPITYKVIIKHYEHVLHLVSELSTAGTVLRWPPDPDIIAAAGGVGFGCLQMPCADDTLGRTKRLDLSKPLETDELRIPPILRYIHPKMTAKTYQQCRRDPLFLYKNVSLCENCYLVYADFGVMLLRVGQDLTKLLTSDASSSAADRGFSASAAVRPSSADWRSMSSVHRRGTATQESSRFNPSVNHSMAKENSIGLRSAYTISQPDLPRVVRKADETHEVLAEKNLTGFGSSVASVQSTATKQHTNLNYDPDEIKRLVAERERNFFKDIAKNPQLRDQHPLMHLITAQQKMALIEEQSGVFNSKNSVHTESLFESSYGSIADDQYDKYASYKEKIPFIGRTLKSVQKKQQKINKSFSRSSSKITDDGSGTVDEAARKHSDFLKQSMRRVSSHKSTASVDTSPQRIRTKTRTSTSTSPERSKSVVSQEDSIKSTPSKGKAVSKVSSVQQPRKASKDSIKTQETGDPYTSTAAARLVEQRVLKQSESDEHIAATRLVETGIRYLTSSHSDRDHSPERRPQTVAAEGVTATVVGTGVMNRVLSNVF